MATMVPRPAATLALLRDAAGGPEVLMLQRTQSAVFLGGAYVFPGGSLDTTDTDPRVVQRVKNLPAQNPPIAYWMAAIREWFGGAGVLLACDNRGKLIEPERARAL